MKTVDHYFFVFKWTFWTIKLDYKLWQIYKAKKKGFTKDFSCRFLGIPRKIKSYEKTNHTFSFKHDIEGVYCLYQVERNRHEDRYFAHYDLLGYQGEKHIRQCTWKEFKEIYGYSILQIFELHKDQRFFF